MEKWTLEYYESKFGDFTVAHAEDGDKFSPWKKLSEVLPSERHTINLRFIFPTEVVFDCETEQTKDGVVKLLKEKKYGFTLWKTGSRGFHVHMFIPALDEMPPDMRGEIKGIYIEKFGGDEKMKEPRRMIALEGRPHFKTGNQKTLLEEYGDPENNVLETEVFIKMHERLKGAAVQTVPSSKKPKPGAIRYGERLYLHCREIGRKEKLPQGNRHNIFLKNMAIGAVLFEDPQFMEGILEDICVAQGMKNKEYKGWLGSAKKGKYNTFNVPEMITFLKESKLPVYQPVSPIRKEFKMGIIYQDEENQYWTYNPKNKIEPYSLLTNFVFLVTSVSVARRQTFFSIDIYLSKGDIVHSKMELSQTTRGTMFHAWLYSQNEAIVVYDKRRFEFLAEFLRHEIDEARKDVPVVRIQTDLYALLYEGFRKHRIGIQGIKVGMASPEVYIGKQIRGTDRMVLYPTLLLRFLNSHGMKLLDSRELLELLRDELGLTCEHTPVRQGAKLIRGWEVRGGEILGLLDKAAEESAAENEKPTGTTPTLKEDAEKLLARLKKMKDGGEKVENAEDATKMYHELDVCGCFEGEENSDIRAYLEDSGAVPF
jgi:hypothetical protein